MALALTPIAVTALRYALVAGAAYGAARRAQPAPRDQRAEDALDATAEGLGLSRDGDGLRASGKWRRAWRLGAFGPGLAFELTGLARLRWRRLGRLP